MLQKREPKYTAHQRFTEISISYIHLLPLPGGDDVFTTTTTTTTTTTIKMLGL